MKDVEVFVLMIIGSLCGSIISASIARATMTKDTTVSNYCSELCSPMVSNWNKDHCECATNNGWEPYKK